MKLTRDVIQPGTNLQVPPVPSSSHCTMLLAYSTFFTCTRTVEFEVLEILNDQDGGFCNAFPDEVRHGGP
jgi:hypothetical protein